MSILEAELPFSGIIRTLGKIGIDFKDLSISEAQELYEDEICEKLKEKVFTLTSRLKDYNDFGYDFTIKFLVGKDSDGKDVYKSTKDFNQTMKLIEFDTSSLQYSVALSEILDMLDSKFDNMIKVKAQKSKQK